MGSRGFFFYFELNVDSLKGSVLLECDQFDDAMGLFGCGQLVSIF